MTTVCATLSVLTLAAAFFAATAENMKRAALALWITGLGIGGIYLTLGAEALAVIQWILSTLAAISFVFFAVMFGEYDPAPLDRAQRRARLLPTLLALVLGAAFTVVVYLGAGSPNIVAEPQIPAPAPGNDLVALGTTLTHDHLLSLEVIALTLFLILVGGGVVARPESNGSEPGETRGGNPV